MLHFYCFPDERVMPVEKPLWRALSLCRGRGQEYTGPYTADQGKQKNKDQETGDLPGQASKTVNSHRIFPFLTDIF
jgi:hypothetical protein